jgi:protein-disulfide isomerase
MSSKRAREKRREEQLAQVAETQSNNRRKWILRACGIASLIVLAGVVALIAAAGGGGGGDMDLEEVDDANELVGGIPQKGMTIGNPKAKVKLIEFGDLQCPVCKQYSEELLPQILEGPVKQGQATIEFRNFTIIGPQSIGAGTAAIAAGKQGRGWNFLEIFYRNQGRENSGYANDEFLTAVAKAAGVKEIARWNKERRSMALKTELAKSTEEAQRLGFTGTPSFAVRGPNSNGLELLGTPGSAAAIEEGINKAS